MKHLARTLAVIVAACGDDRAARPDGAPGDAAADAPTDAAAPVWPFELPFGFPVPRLPPGKRLTPELAELGRHLFYDVRLSGNGTQACASCHEQARAFTDGRVTPTGSTGTVLRRNAMSLANIAYNPTQTWANHLLAFLEQQAPVPMFGTDPVELGITGNEDAVLARLRGDPTYQALYAAAFPGATEPLDLGHVVAALSAFERRLISGNSPLDKHRRGEIVLDESALRGEALIFSERLECHHCHGGFNFSIAVDHAALSEPNVAFFNTGLYNVGGTGAYPAADQGLFDVTFTDGDQGRFRPPTLRNIAVTAPYMHDGSMATLDDVLTFYERGGRLIESGPNAGDGKLNPHKSSFVGGFTLTAQERADLLAFFAALTDDTFLTDPSLSDPFAP
ncbi:MAG: di-heme enzyme [Deltaproteobacteria bacterium]|nr:di-heme enzyme [Deltaproteobacteria bacterium]